MITIDVAIMTRGSLQEQILKGLSSSLNKLIGKNKHKINIINAQGPNNEHLALAIERRLRAGSDVLVSIGTEASLVSKSVINKLDSKTPLVFCGTHDPIGAGIIKSIDRNDENITGVISERDDKHIPAQLILLLHPNIKSVFISFRKASLKGRMAYEAEKLQKYFRDRGKEVFFYEYPEDNIISQAMANDIKRSEAVLLLEGALYIDDVIKISEVANKHNVPVFGYMEQALQKGAMFGLRQDIDFMGVKVGEYCFEVLKQNKSACNLPVAILENSRRIVVNTKAMATHGVSFSEDILAAHDGAEEYPEIPVKQFGKVMSYKNEFEDDLCHAVSSASRADKQSVYFSEVMSGRIFDTEWQDAQTNFALDSKQQLFFCIGKKLTNLMIDKMHKRNEHYPIVRVCTKQELAEPVSIVQAKPVKKMATVITPDADPLTPIKLLMLVKPAIKKVALLCNIPEQHLPQRYQHRIKTIQAFADEHGIDLTIEREHVLFKLKSKLENICDSHDAVFFFEDGVHETIVDWFANYSHQHKALICAGSARHRDKFPLAYYMDKLAFAEKLFAPLRQILQSDTMPEDIYISYEECFRISINQEVCKKYGVTLSPGIQALLSTPLN